MKIIKLDECCYLVSRPVVFYLPPHYGSDVFHGANFLHLMKKIKSHTGRPRP